VTRNEIIHEATPNVLAMLFVLNDVCGYCGKIIQSLAEAELDHIVTVHEFASGPLPIEQAIRECNALSNLRPVHGRCNHVAGARIASSIPGLCSRAGRIGGRISGRMNVENKRGICAPGIAAKAGRIGGRKHVESGHLQKVSAAGARARNHKQWHVRRGIKNPKCPLCVAA
jgi:hypothetical protein